MLAVCKVTEWFAIDTDLTVFHCDCRDVVVLYLDSTLPAGDEPVLDTVNCVSRYIRVRIESLSLFLAPLLCYSIVCAVLDGDCAVSLGNVGDVLAALNEGSNCTKVFLKILDGRVEPSPRWDNDS